MKYIITGRYVFSGLRFFVGEADTMEMANFSVNNSVTVLVPHSDILTWIGETVLKIVSGRTGLNYLVITIDLQSDYTPEALDLLRYRRRK